MLGGAGFLPSTVGRGDDEFYSPHLKMVINQFAINDVNNPPKIIPYTSKLKFYHDRFNSHVLTNTLPWNKLQKPKAAENRPKQGKFIFQPSIFSGAVCLLVSGRVYP